MVPHFPVSSKKRFRKRPVQFDLIKFYFYSIRKIGRDLLTNLGYVMEPFPKAVVEARRVANQSLYGSSISFDGELLLSFQACWGGGAETSLSSPEAVLGEESRGRPCRRLFAVEKGASPRRQ